MIPSPRHLWGGGEGECGKEEKGGEMGKGGYLRDEEALYWRDITRGVMETNEGRGVLEKLRRGILERWGGEGEY